MTPAYAAMYPYFARTAREYGYALAIHGTMGRDLDLIAVPWVESARPAGELVEAIRESARGWLAEGSDGPLQETQKPHGRRAWLIHLDVGCIDLSVMPLMSGDKLNETNRRISESFVPHG